MSAFSLSLEDQGFAVLGSPSDPGNSVLKVLRFLRLFRILRIAKLQMALDKIEQEIEASSSDWHIGSRKSVAHYR